MNTQDPVQNPLNIESSSEPSEPLNALAALRSIRQARGLSLEDVASRLKFAQRQIDAFENGRWDELPSGIGLRTLAKNYSRLLGIDLSALEPMLPRQEVRGGSSMALQHTSSSGFGAPIEQPVASSRSWPWVVVILLVVLVVLGVAVWQSILPREMLPGWIKGMFE